MSADWLLQPARASVRVLFVDHSLSDNIHIQGLDPRAVSVEGCRDMVEGWLTASGNRRIKTLLPAQTAAITDRYGCTLDNRVSALILQLTGATSSAICTCRGAPADSHTSSAYQSLSARC
jgi:hypothetical protein